MAHYAFIDSDTYEVVNVITGKDEDDLAGLPAGYSSWEEYYGDINGVLCKRTSRNTKHGKHLNEDGSLSDTQEKAIRVNYAEIGGTYDPVRDAFICANQVPGWILNEETLDYEAPVPVPEGFEYPIWNAESEVWENSPPNTEP